AMNSRTTGKFSCVLGTLALSCAVSAAQLSETAWGTLADGTPVTRYTLTNAHGARASFMAYGAAILEVQAPDRRGELADVVLGFDAAAVYQNGNGAYVGLTIGRFASRIFGTQLLLGGEPHTLSAQAGRGGVPGDVILHGGPEGFSSRIWTASRVT